MKTVYGYTQKPRLVKALVYAEAILGIAGLILYIILSGDRDEYFFIYMLSFLLIQAAVLTQVSFLQTVELDDEKKTLTLSTRKKYPISILDLDRVTYKQSKKGRFYALLLRDTGVRLLDARISKDSADRLVEKIREINPTVRVEYKSYI